MNFIKRVRASISAKIQLVRAIQAAYALQFVANHQGRSGGAIIGEILGLCVGLYVAGSTLPDSIVFITNGTLWTGAPAAVQTLGTTVVGIVAIVAFIWMLLKTAGMTGD